MPMTSKAQSRLMYAAAFIEATPKKAYQDMPEKASGKKKAVLKKKGGY